MRFESRCSHYEQNTIRKKQYDEKTNEHEEDEPLPDETYN